MSIKVQDTKGTNFIVDTTAKPGIVGITVGKALYEFSRDEIVKLTYALEYFQTVATLERFSDG